MVNVPTLSSFGFVDGCADRWFFWFMVPLLPNFLVGFGNRGIIQKAAQDPRGTVSVPLTTFPLTMIPLTMFPLTTIPLTTFPLKKDHAWPG
jgi:hypothetical protein